MLTSGTQFGARLRLLSAEREKALLALRGAEFAIAQEVARERAAGASWPEIGAALGISRQGARQRFGDRE
ncbi:hypothetical protein EUA98_17955 [Pengzhenrongella frigida]|uniref:AsnC family protein n=1 Tax=Pengzhenrongella frigida TaxID=1259133 RepID=A0A4Q5MVT7_9MICO|nr:hypothetical protein EUA98_17955 [Cellulomonas sp. HLT2-17]